MSPEQVYGVVVVLAGVCVGLFMALPLWPRRTAPRRYKVVRNGLGKYRIVHIESGKQVAQGGDYGQLIPMETRFLWRARRMARWCDRDDARIVKADTWEDVP